MAPTPEHTSQTHLSRSEQGAVSSGDGPPEVVKGDSDSRPPDKYPRFYLRSLLVVFVPFAISAYYLFISFYFLLPKKDIVKFGYSNEIWIYYSWFVVGVFGLGLSQYGLVGVEAGMLQSPSWKVKCAMALMLHSGSTWSGPGGWLKVFKIVVFKRRFVAYKLWFLLATLSLLAFVALPLSGLGMELSDGFIGSLPNAMVIGRTFDNFNMREVDQVSNRARDTWKAGAQAIIPGAGILYTPPWVDREKFTAFKTVPNSFPADEEIPEMFLTTQARTPIGGTAWGMRIACNCSLVRSASEFTGINRNDTTGWAIKANDTTTSYSAKNLHIYAEIARREFPRTVPLPEFISGPIYNDTEPVSFDLKDFSNADIIEFAAWQLRRRSSYDIGDWGYGFNSTISTPVNGLGQPFILAENETVSANMTFSNAISYRDSLGSFQRILSIAEPIGVRCVRVSAVGYAKLDARTSSFTSFEQTASPRVTNETEVRTPRFGDAAGRILMSADYFDLFRAANFPPPVTISNSVHYRTFLLPEILRQAMYRAHGMDAIQLMYDGVYEFSGAAPNSNLTYAEKAKVLEMGTIHPLIPAGFFFAWALGCALLGSLYGFRRRWSEVLDGYSMFKFGVDNAEEVRTDPAYSTSTSFADNDMLLEIPGRIGDSRRNGSFGHIGLVRRGHEIKGGRS
ncbi:hypothetical protein AJ80_06731 [Polytolypa hystricis UAMH7299]|uniref:Uncharacterized protein n=1 Tax=Polytolypa hystricis (strain UAMH7299) TaxID=1447883 RepID=A0A2B7XL05_POLH7|nr:hypothetical protein AJ80_06731 [Polytolypa hystricis UAMH7299]